MTFNLYVLKCRFVVKTPLVFPTYTAANVFRGALGFALEHLGDSDRTFHPVQETGPSGLADPPRPFVIRAEHLNGCRFVPREQFSMALHIFDGSLVNSFVDALRVAAAGGLGPLHGTAELAAFDNDPVSIDLRSGSQEVHRAGVRFLTATELKHQGAIVSRPAFGVLIGRTRDRVSTLRSLYGEGTLDVDFQEMNRRALTINLTRVELETVHRERRSSRTGQVHPLDGFTGYVEYEGDLTEFWPFLVAAQYTGVGRQTVWGKGAIEVSRLA